LALYTHDRIELEERDRRLRIVEVHCGEDARRESVRVDLESHAESRQRAHARLDDFMHSKRVGPELFIAERVEAEDLLAAPHQRMPGPLFVLPLGSSLPKRWNCRSRRAIAAARMESEC
jgi:hypothetical protein